MPPPIYTPDTCPKPAYQLDWSYSLFWHRPPANFQWLAELIGLCEPDGIRILQHEFKEPKLSQFLTSTVPAVSPLFIAQRVKGRLQHLLRNTQPKAFQRNYGLRSIGSTKRSKLEQYLAIQVAHHPMADPLVTNRLKQYQIYNKEVDFAVSRTTSHSLCWYNLHVVLVNQGSLVELRDEALARLRDMIISASKAKRHELSRAAILPDHIHLALSCLLEETPEQIVLSYMNNLAYACEMKAVFQA